MKKLLTSILIIVLPTAIFAIAGAGLQVTPGMGTIGATTDTKSLATMSTTEFSIPFSIGGYLYIDAIPFVDLEVDLMAMGNKYEFVFVNNLGTIGPYDFGWASLSTYFTLRKKLLGVGIPLLAKAKLFYGGGFNMHAVTPLMTVDLMESTLGGNIDADPAGLTEDTLIDFLKENKIDASGFHIQTGVQFKVLMLDTFLFYRHTFAKDVIPGSDAFGSLNFRLGFGI